MHVSISYKQQELEREKANSVKVREQTVTHLQSLLSELTAIDQVTLFL